MSEKFKYSLSVGTDIILTEINDDDRAALIEHFCEKEIFLQTFAIPYPYGDPEADWFLRRMKEKLATEAPLQTWAIRQKNDRNLIGVFGYHDYESGSHKVEIGYWLAKPYWGQGIATRVVQRMCKRAFEEMNVQRIYAKAFARNRASVRVLEKAGFKQEGLLRKDFLKEGELLDVTLLAILRDEI